MEKIWIGEGLIHVCAIITAQSGAVNKNLEALFV